MKRKKKELNFHAQQEYKLIQYFVYLLNSDAMTYTLLVVNAREYLLHLSSNAPAIKGSVVTFTADLLETNGTLADVGDTLKWVRFNFLFLHHFLFLWKNLKYSN